MSQKQYWQVDSEFAEESVEGRYNWKDLILFNKKKSFMYSEHFQGFWSRAQQQQERKKNLKDVLSYT